MARDQTAELTALFDAARTRHQIDVFQPGLLGCTCGASLPVAYGDDGQPLHNPAIRHHHEQMAEAVVDLIDARVAAYQHNALEMARKADAAERRAEEAEFHVEQLIDARDRAERRNERAEALIDSWERDAPDHSNPVFIGRLREVLRRDPAPVRLRDECAHEWLDRPESDTRECLICGTEVSG